MYTFLSVRIAGTTFRGRSTRIPQSKNLNCLFGVCNSTTSKTTSTIHSSNSSSSISHSCITINSSSSSKAFKLIRIVATWIRSIGETIGVTLFCRPCHCRTITHRAWATWFVVSILTSITRPKYNPGTIFHNTEFNILFKKLDLIIWTNLFLMIFISAYVNCAHNWCNYYF